MLSPQRSDEPPYETLATTDDTARPRREKPRLPTLHTSIPVAGDLHSPHPVRCKSSPLLTHDGLTSPKAAPDMPTVVAFRGTSRTCAVAAPIASSNSAPTGVSNPGGPSPIVHAVSQTALMPTLELPSSNDVVAAAGPLGEGEAEEGWKWGSMLLHDIINFRVGPIVAIIGLGVLLVIWACRPILSSGSISDVKTTPVVEHRHTIRDGSSYDPSAIARTSLSVLLVSDSTREAFTTNILRVGNGLFTPEDQNLIEGVVAEGLANVSRILTDFTDVNLLDVEVAAAQSALRLLSEPEVQSLGLLVVSTIQQRSKSSGARSKVDRRSLQQQDLISAIARRLENRLQAVEETHTKFISSSMESLRAGHRWEMTFFPSNLRIAETMGPGWLSPTSSFSQKEASIDDKRASIAAGVLEQSRFLLNSVHSEAYLRLPDIQSVFGLNPGSLLTCEDNKEPKKILDFVARVACPLKLGIFGMDVL